MTEGTEKKEARNGGKKGVAKSSSWRCRKSPVSRPKFKFSLTIWTGARSLGLWQKLFRVSQPRRVQIPVNNIRSTVSFPRKKRGVLSLCDLCATRAAIFNGVQRCKSTRGKGLKTAGKTSLNSTSLQLVFCPSHDRDACHLAGLLATRVYV